MGSPDAEDHPLGPVRTHLGVSAQIGVGVAGGTLVEEELVQLAAVEKQGLGLGGERDLAEGVGSRLGAEGFADGGGRFGDFDRFCWHLSRILSVNITVHCDYITNQRFCQCVNRDLTKVYEILGGSGRAKRS